MSFPFDQYDRLPALQDDEPDTCELICPCGSWLEIRVNEGLRDGAKFTCQRCKEMFVVMICRVSPKDGP